jgi:hypothetical protein
MGNSRSWVLLSHKAIDDLGKVIVADKAKLTCFCSFKASGPTGDNGFNAWVGCMFNER